MAGADRAFPVCCEIRRIHQGLRCGGIYLLYRRSKEGTHARLLGQDGILLNITGVSIEIFPGGELGGIYEDGGDYDIAVAASSPHERKMPLMQGAHRRNKTDNFSIFAGCAQIRAEGSDLVKRAHSVQCLSLSSP